MKRLLLGIVGVLIAATLVSAAPVNCPNTSFSVLANTTSSVVATCGGLTFTNFQLLNVTPGGQTGRLDVNAISFDSATGIVNINENPNLGPTGHENLLFTVSGATINALDLSVGGVDGVTVQERACANPIATSGFFAGLCTNAAGTATATPIADFGVSGANTANVVAITPSNTLYMYKDIAAGSVGGLSDMNESFHVVPEPASLILLGAGLVLIGSLRKRAA